MPGLDPDTLYVNPRKIRDYLLDPDHPDGTSKADFFTDLGFSRERPWELAEALLDLARREEAPEPFPTRHGLKYVVDGEIRSRPVRTVWIVDSPDGSARLITAYPRGIRR